MLSLYWVDYRTCLICEDESSQPSQKSAVTCCIRYGWKWLGGLTSACYNGQTHSAVRRYKKTWEVSLSICRSHVRVLFAIQAYQFCELCQGIMNNPVHQILKLSEDASLYCTLTLHFYQPVTSSAAYILGEIVSSKVDAAQPLVRVFMHYGQIVPMIRSLAKWEISKVT